MFKYDAETNQITKDGEIIGALDGKTIVLTVELAPAHKGQVKKYLIEEGYEIDDYRKADGDAPPLSEVQMLPIPPQDTSFVPPIPPAVTSNTPMPDEDPRFGDKTPAVVEWYRDNNPEEYERRYKNRKTHLGRI